MITEEFLPLKANDSEQRDLIDLARSNRSFYDVWKYKIDLTATIFQELYDILYGKVRRNFVINIKGNIGRQTGIFKSSLGIQLALKLDPTFNFAERVAFTPNELISKVQQYAKRKQIFLMDERVRDFKISGEQRLANIIESCRQKQLCFILIGVPEQQMTFSDYHFERMGESDDKYLDKKVIINGEEENTGRKTVYFLVKKITESKKVYRGYLKWNIVSLENPEWQKFWSEYSVYKAIHQDKAVQASLTGFNFRQEAEKLKQDARFQNCYDESGRLIRAKLKSLVYEMFPDNVAQERDMIYTEILFPNKQIVTEDDL